MSVFMRNMQRIVKVNRKLLKENANLIVSCAGYEGYDIGLMLVHDEKIRHLNHQYRGIDEVTDVLAFPYHQILPENAGLLPEVHPDERILGDIVFGMPYIASGCLRHTQDLQTTLVSMFVHGLCHLVGFDHESHDQWLQMHRKELDILEKFNKLSSYRCKPLLGVGHYEA